MRNMRKRFRPLMATKWNKVFDKIFFLTPSPLLQSAITRKGNVPQPHVLIFFLISSTFSISSATADLVISR